MKKINMKYVDAEPWLGVIQSEANAISQLFIGLWDQKHFCRLIITHNNRIININTVSLLIRSLKSLRLFLGHLQRLADVFCSKVLSEVTKLCYFFNFISDEELYVLTSSTLNFNWNFFKKSHQEKKKTSLDTRR